MTRNHEFRADADRRNRINFHSKPAHRRSRKWKIAARRAARRAAHQQKI